MNRRPAVQIVAGLGVHVCVLRLQGEVVGEDISAPGCVKEEVVAEDIAAVIQEDIGRSSGII